MKPSSLKCGRTLQESDADIVIANDSDLRPYVGVLISLFYEISHLIVLSY